MGQFLKVSLVIKVIIRIITPKFLLLDSPLLIVYRVPLAFHFLVRFGI